MKKHFKFIGSLLLCGYIVPMYFFVVNYPQLDIKDTALIIALFTAIALALAGILWTAFRDTDKISFLLYGIGFIFWFSMPVATFVQNNSNLFDFVFKHNYQWLALFICCFGAIISLFILLKHCYNFIKNLNKVISIFVLTLSGILFLNGTFKTFSNLKIHDKILNNTTIVEGEKYPNVYHILLDAHPNLKGMEIIGGDLKPFYKELESLGFVTFPESRSNYPSTSWSVSSMLNMDYLEPNWETKSISYYQNSIHNNKVFKHFQKRGYNLHLNLSNYCVVQALYKSRTTSNNTYLLAHLYTLLQETPIRHFFLYFSSKTFKKLAISDIEFNFKLGENIKKSYGNQSNLIYSHFLCPHEPCIFGEQAENCAMGGICIPNKSNVFLSPDTHKAYRENIYGIDNLALKSIKEILKQYETESIKPIIILHSDHSILYCGRGLKSSYITPDTVYGNLLALYIPDEWKPDAKNLKFINLYRWIFNHLFGDNFKYFDENRQE